MLIKERKYYFIKIITLSVMLFPSTGILAKDSGSQSWLPNIGSNIQNSVMTFLKTVGAGSKIVQKPSSNIDDKQDITSKGNMYCVNVGRSYLELKDYFTPWVLYSFLCYQLSPAGAAAVDALVSLSGRRNPYMEQYSYRNTTEIPHKMVDYLFATIFFFSLYRLVTLKSDMYSVNSQVEVLVEGRKHSKKTKTTDDIMSLFKDKNNIMMLFLTLGVSYAFIIPMFLYNASSADKIGIKAFTDIIESPIRRTVTFLEEYDIIITPDKSDDHKINYIDGIVYPIALWSLVHKLHPVSWTQYIDTQNMMMHIVMPVALSFIFLIWDTIRVNHYGGKAFADFLIQYAKDVCSFYIPWGKIQNINMQFIDLTVSIVMITSILTMKNGIFDVENIDVPLGTLGVYLGLFYSVYALSHIIASIEHSFCDKENREYVSNIVNRCQNHLTLKKSEIKTSPAKTAAYIYGIFKKPKQDKRTKEEIQRIIGEEATLEDLKNVKKSSYRDILRMHKKYKSFILDNPNNPDASYTAFCNKYKNHIVSFYNENNEDYKISFNIFHDLNKVFKDIEETEQKIYIHSALNPDSAGDPKSLAFGVHKNQLNEAINTVEVKLSTETISVINHNAEVKSLVETKFDKIPAPKNRIL